MQLLRRKIAGFIRKQALFAPGDTVLVALSGGADSVALLDILANLPDFPLQLIPVHLNHLLRGDESDGDELFARELAASYGLPVEISRCDVAGLANEKGLSLEEAGRSARYALFRELAAKHTAAAVALGHHMDDQAETVLIRLLRGSAGSGLSGIRPRSRDGLFVRPLLTLSREEIVQYLRKAGSGWREDSSNIDTKFLRNRVRHELLPLLRGYNPKITENLNQVAAALGVDEDYLAAAAEEAFGRCSIPSRAGVVLDLGSLSLEPAALRARIYRMAIAGVKGDLRRISFRHLSDIESLAGSSRPSGILDLPDAIMVRREYARLHFSRQESAPALGDFLLLLEGIGSYSLPCGRTLAIEQLPMLPGNWRSAGERTLFVSTAELPFPWTLRYFRPGDRFIPYGMTGMKKLKDLFIDRKLPLQQRRRVPLLLSREVIFWVAGVQFSAQAGLAGNEGELLRITLSDL